MRRAGRTHHRWRGPPLLAAALSILGASVAGCVGGRVLEGYPGYPFVAIDLPAAPDSAFFAMQDALEAEGFELDYSEPSDGLIHTRPAELPSGITFLNVVVGPPDGGAAPAGAATQTGSRAWIAGYEPVLDGARRIDPLDEDGWADLRGVAARLSGRLDGGPPVDPGGASP